MRTLTYCIGCGCHDLAACCDERGDPCSWLVQERTRSEIWAAQQSVPLGSGRGVCSACPQHMPRWGSGDRSGPVRPVATQDALMNSLFALLRMIPGYCSSESAEPLTDIEHDEAIRAAAVQVFGPNRDNWPQGVRRAAEGEFE